MVNKRVCGPGDGYDLLIPVFGLSSISLRLPKRFGSRSFFGLTLEGRGRKGVRENKSKMPVFGHRSVRFGMGKFIFFCVLL